MTMFFGYHPDAYWEVTETLQDSDGQGPLEAIDLGALVAGLHGFGETTGQANETEHPLLSEGEAPITMDASMLDMEDPIDA